MRTLLIRTLVAGTITATALILTATTSQASVQDVLASGASPNYKEKDPVENTAPFGTATVQVVKLTHAQATSRLRAAGITWSSSGNCSDRNNPTCTSFSQVNLATIQGAETLKSASGCALNITGGTETGHASGTYSHWNGYKLDYSLYACVGNYIRSHFTYIGGNKWRSGSGNIYFLESNHWDVTYFNCGGC